MAFALIEGLAGIKDSGLAFDKVTLSPRWTATKERDVAMTAKYEASRGYVAYRFSRREDSIALEITGNATEWNLEILLPEGKTATNLVVNGSQQVLQIREIEKSTYVITSICGVGVHRVEVRTA